MYNMPIYNNDFTYHLVFQQFWLISCCFQYLRENENSIDMKHKHPFINDIYNTIYSTNIIYILIFLCTVHAVPCSLCTRTK
jgi:hypothetical protein